MVTIKVSTTVTIMVTVKVTITLMIVGRDRADRQKDGQEDEQVGR
jgi:hypothetical protein